VISFSRLRATIGYRGPGQSQERPIEAVVEAPALEVVGTAQELGLTDAAGHVVVQVLLEGLLEELHADGQVLLLDMQA